MNKKAAAFILLTIFLIQSTQLLIWIRKDDSPPAWDQSWHAMASIDKFNRIFDRTYPGTDHMRGVYHTFNYAHYFYPPFYHVSTIPFYLFFDTNYDSALMTNVLFLLILIISSFLIGKKLHSAEAGLIMAFIVSTAPAYSDLMRDYLVDFPLISMVALGFALLLYTDHFENLKYSILFGITLGLGMLTKWTYVAYLMVPFSMSLKNRSRLKNVLLSLLASSIALTWYTYTRLKILLPALIDSINRGLLMGAPAVTSLSSMTYYLLAITRGYSLFYLIVFVIGASTLTKHHRKERAYFMVMSSILFIYALFTLLSNKDPRFIAPLYVYLACVSAIGIYKLKDKRVRQLIITLVVFFGLFQNIAHNSELTDVDYRFGGLSILNLRGRYPGSSEINIDEILSAINGSGNVAPSVCIVSEASTLNDVNVPYYSLKGNYPIGYMIGNGCNPLSFDYAVVGPIEETWRAYRFKRSKSILEDNIHTFRLVYSSKGVSVYKRVY